MAEPDFAALDAAADDIVSGGESSQPTPDPDTKSDEKIPSARRFRGQFMDMVHPSSDVKVAEKPNFAQRSNNPFGSSNSDDPIAQPETEPMEPDNPEPPIQGPVDDNSDESIDNSYESPFLPDAKVEKRPLGSLDFEVDDRLLSSNEPENDLLSSGTDSGQELLPSGETDEELLIAGEEPEALLSAGDENSGSEAAQTDDQPDDPTDSESVPADPSNTEPKTAEKQEDPKTELPSQNAENVPTGDTRAAIANTMIMPQYKAAVAAAPAELQSPFAASAEPMNRAKTKHFPIWAWILVFILLAVAGAALGAWLYTSGWLA